MDDALLTAYEAVPYDSRPIGASEIGALETVALLHGVNAPPAAHARVLELGCASGGNLIPMAYRYPGSHCLGIDLTPGQIARGRAEIAALGLDNITLDALSIADITDDLGTFDYIICHGVYSWVPPDVQDAILRVCSRNLARGGVAYISYNTLPGWHVRGMVREMVMYHDDPSLAAHDRVVRANAFVDLLASQGGTPATVHTLAIMEEAVNLHAQEEAHFLHEQLEPYNAPLYVSEFVRRAAGAGLRYVSEAQLADRATTPPEWAKQAAGGDRIRVQQYLDFATGRTFRRSLLCHADVAALPEPDPRCVTALHVALRAEPTAPSAEDGARSAGVESFKSASGATMTTNNPLVLAAFHVLLRVAPTAVRFDELLQRVNDRLSVNEPAAIPAPAERAAPLAGALLQCAIGGFLELHRYPSAFTRVISERPRASGIARGKSEEARTVPNLRHAMAELTGVERALLRDLDGTHDRTRLLDRLIERMHAGELTTEGEVPDRSELNTIIGKALARLASVALLEG